ncbi:MAG: hypothetical protein P4L26_02890 [Terracidiphilus sp.]|nr:hypothetical protein [Terracidiphilus sp.]
MIDTKRNTLLRGLAANLAVLFLAAALAAQTPSTPAQNAPAPAPQPAAGQKPDWMSYSYPEDGFTVSFPVPPELAKHSVPTDAGTFELRTYLGEVASSALYVGVCDYGSAVSGRDPQTVLDGAQNGALTNVKGHLVSGKKITLGIYPGLAFEAENDTMHFTAHIFLVGTTLYQTLTAAPIATPYPDTTRFLDSFQLIARAAK